MYSASGYRCNAESLRGRWPHVDRKCTWWYLFLLSHPHLPSLPLSLSLPLFLPSLPLSLPPFLPSLLLSPNPPRGLWPSARARAPSLLKAFLRPCACLAQTPVMQGRKHVFCCLEQNCVTFNKIVSLQYLSEYTYTISMCISVFLMSSVSYINTVISDDMLLSVSSATLSIAMLCCSSAGSCFSM